MRVLLAEDDRALSEALVFHIRDEGYAVDAFEDGLEACEALLQGGYDVAILDRMMPGMDGMTLLRKARAQGFTAPVLFLTALGALQDRVDGLDAGADDYLVKPFAMEELLARLRAIERRLAGDEAQNRLTCADIVFEADRLLLTGPQKAVRLSKREAQLLGLLLRDFGKSLRRETLFARVWGQGADVEDSNLDSYIHFLRKRLRDVGSACRIATLRGVGYMLEKS